MIRGICHPSGCAIISGFLYFPDPVDEVIDVPFLVDTGADGTTLHATDLSKLEADLRPALTTFSPITYRVAGGGSVRPFIYRCGLLFPHDDGSLSRFSLSVSLIPEPSSMGHPALLGMDVLSQGSLYLDMKSGRVEFDAPTGRIINIPAPS